MAGDIAKDAVVEITIVDTIVKNVVMVTMVGVVAIKETTITGRGITGAIQEILIVEGAIVKIEDVATLV